MGTLIVDNISSYDELNNSACYVLTFDKTGFDKVEIYPLILNNGRVKIAQKGLQNEILKKKYINLTQEISHDTFFADIDNKLVIEFYNNINTSRKKEKPKKVYDIQKQRKQLRHIKTNKSDILLKTVPKWAIKKQVNISFENKFQLIASNVPEVFKKGTGFLIENIININEPLSSDRWEVHIVGKHIDSLDKFEDYHPVSHGIYNPVNWNKGDIVLDHAVVRPKINIIIGTYELYFGFYNFNKKEYIQTDNNNLILIGTIDVVDKGVPNYASGIDWDGRKNR
jgi:hypothetical protein